MQNVTWKDTASEDSLSSIIQIAAMEMDLFHMQIEYITNGEGFGYEFLKSVEIWFYFNNMRRNIAIDKKSYLIVLVDLRKNARFFFFVIDVFVFSLYGK